MGERSANLGSADRGAVAATFARRTMEGDRERRVDVVAAAAEKRGEKEKRTFLADFE